MENQQDFENDGTRLFFEADIGVEMEQRHVMFDRVMRKIDWTYGEDETIFMKIVLNCVMYFVLTLILFGCLFGIVMMLKGMHVFLSIFFG